MQSDIALGALADGIPWRAAGVGPDGRQRCACPLRGSKLEPAAPTAYGYRIKG
jgi:hypothetical protein